MLGTMVLQDTLFDNEQLGDKPGDIKKDKKKQKEVMPLEKLKNLEDKIATAIDRVKTLKEEKAVTDRKMRDLEDMLNEKNQELEQLKAEKNLLKVQLETLLSELEGIGVE